MFAGASLRGVAHNAMIQRNYDPYGPELEPRHAIGRAAAGVAWVAGWGSLTFGLAVDTREFDAQREAACLRLAHPPRGVLRTAMSFFRGIRVRLLLVALSLLALPWLAAKFIARMETSLRAQQEQSIGATSRALAVALSDRPGLFSPPGAGADPEEEERRRIVALFAAADTDAAASLGAAYAPSEAIERLLTVAGRRGTRLWVVDTRSRVRGLWGSLRMEEPEPGAGSWLRPIASRVVPTPRVAVGDESRPVRDQINGALIGISRTPTWRGTVNRDVAILSAAQPIYVSDDIVGALVVEETTASIQLLKQSALESLLGVTLAVVGGAFLVLLAYAGRLAARIRRLHREAEAAIDSQGRVRGAITPSDSRDEIGDLARTMSAVLERLRAYNAYLEAMAGAPLARAAHPGGGGALLARQPARARGAGGGAQVHRARGRGRGSAGAPHLATVGVHAPRAPARERRARALRPRARGRPDASRAIAPRMRRASFQLELAAGPGVDRRRARRDRATPRQAGRERERLRAAGTPVGGPAGRAQPGLAPRGGEHRAAAAREARSRLFDSMVTLREGQGPAGADAAHLGLGLYIVRLVAQFHGGTVRASNLAEGKGVRFEVDLP
jgi:hypothetical protein